LLVDFLFGDAGFGKETLMFDSARPWVPLVFGRMLSLGIGPRVFDGFLGFVGRGSVDLMKR
jgi:hypothetical protein